MRENSQLPPEGSGSGDKGERGRDERGETMGRAQKYIVIF